LASGISRRTFLLVTGGALAVHQALPRALFSEETVPALLDHILLGCSDLQRGIDFVEQRTGVRAVFGGVHPGRGTQNALLSLGERHYLEIIAPDPKQSSPVWHQEILKLTDPRLIGWAAHVADIEQIASRLAHADIAYDGPQPGSRKRPDGRLLRWKTLTLKDDQAGLLPFFIEWSVDSQHPSTDAPAGCRLVRFELVSPDSMRVVERVKLLGLGVPVAEGNPAQIRATFRGYKDELTITS